MSDVKQEREEGTARTGAAGGSEKPVDAGTGGEVVRGRPGRRTVAERKEAVLALLSGKASVDPLARKYGVLPETVEKWREQALSGIEEVLLRGDAATPKERELERELSEVKKALATLALDHALAMQGVKEWKEARRPTRPARSRR